MTGASADKAKAAALAKYEGNAVGHPDELDSEAGITCGTCAFRHEIVAWMDDLETTERGLFE